MGSYGHNLVGDSLMHLLTSSSVTGLKVLKAGGTKSDASLKEPEVENVKPEKFTALLPLVALPVINGIALCFNRYKYTVAH